MESEGREGLQKGFKAQEEEQEGVVKGRRENG